MRLKRSGLRDQSGSRTWRTLCIRRRWLITAMFSACFIVALFSYGILLELHLLSDDSWTEQPWNSEGFNPYGRPEMTNVSFLEMYNAVEDVRLQQYIASAEHKIKAVIVFLANTPRLRSLAKSLRHLHKYFNRKFRYPIVIFHEADFLPFTESVRHAGVIDDKSFLTSTIFFQQVDLSVPDWIFRRFGPPPQTACGRSIGYRGMCRFQAKLMYEQKIMRHFDYYWRLDDDSKINAPIPFDAFEALVSGGFSYGFALSTIDDCAPGVYRLAEDYMKARNITPTFFNTLKSNEIIFNNFEISSMKFWLSKQYRDYIEYVDSLGGIYTERWGDAPIKTLALSLYVPLRELHRFKEISYYHYGDLSERTNFLL